MQYLWLGINVAGIFISIGLMIAIYLRTESKEYTPLLMAVCCTLVITLSRSFCLMSYDINEMITLAKTEYLGKCFVTFFGMLFVERWKNIKFPPKLIASLFLINTAAAAFIFTMEHHHIYYESYRIVPSKLALSGYVMDVKGTPLYYAYMLCVGFQFGLIFYGIIYAQIRDRRSGMKAGGWGQTVVIVSLFVPLVLMISYFTGFFKEDDPTTVGICIAIFFLAIVILFGGLYDTVAIAKENAIDQLDVAFFVFNNQLGLLFANDDGNALMERVGSTEVVNEICVAIRAGFNQLFIRETGYSVKIVNVEFRGERVGYAVSLIDITDVLEQNEELREMRDQAESASRAKSDFISTVSHEIRTPMNVIVGITDILLREDLTYTAKEYLQNIKYSGNNLLAIINDILDISKVESGKMTIVEERYSPVQLLDDLGLMFLNRIAENEVALIFDIDRELNAELIGDAVRIRQIIVNLVNNAIKFTEKGSVTLGVKIVEKTDDEVSIRFSVKDTGIGISFMDQKKLFRAFSQVNEVKNHHREGTGLGLALCQHLAGMMGGVIEIDSVPNEGSEFYFTLKQRIGSHERAAVIKNRKLNGERITIVHKPYSAMQKDYSDKLFAQFADDLEVLDIEDVASGRVIPDYLFIDHREYNEINEIFPPEVIADTKVCVLWNAVMGMPPKNAYPVRLPFYSASLADAINNKRKQFKNISVTADYKCPDANILLVDDNEMNRVVTKGLLSPLGLSVDEAKDGKMAVDMVKDIRYDLVLMDHMMPVMDGVEATKTIRAMEGDYYKNLPILALSANALDEVKDLFLSSGMNAYVMKPVNTADLFEKVKLFLPPQLIVPLETEEESTDTALEAELDALQEKLPLLDIEYAYENCGSIEMLTEMLNLFGLKSRDKIGQIKSLSEADSLRSFTIEVHAMKNNARLIGYRELADDFYELEKFGDAKNAEGIKEILPETCDKLSKVSDMLELYMAENTDDNTIVKSIDKSGLINALNLICESMDLFDLDGADAAFESIEHAKLPDEIDEEEVSALIMKLKIMLSDVNYDGVVAVTNKIKELIE
ncbi:MAG: response regulator [Lachnospiraceae bacterium]|nr:response regulator [Lachnospiraceae bacterium]